MLMLENEPMTSSNRRMKDEIVRGLMVDRFGATMPSATRKARCGRLKRQGPTRG